MVLDDVWGARKCNYFIEYKTCWQIEFSPYSSFYTKIYSFNHIFTNVLFYKSFDFIKALQESTYMENKNYMHNLLVYKIKDNFHYKMYL